LTTIELRGGPEAVRAARHAIEQFADQQELSRIDDLRLLVSELVTNSVLHGGAGPQDRLRLSIRRPGDRVRVEVHDNGRAWGRHIRSTSLESVAPPGGWGLMLVGALADRWGIEGGEGTCVWFELEAAAN
jgi:anti-sigma regulatory factor (Ser/Thr protein kinase)